MDTTPTTEHPETQDDLSPVDAEVVHNEDEES